MYGTLPQIEAGRTGAEAHVSDVFCGSAAKCLEIKTHLTVCFECYINLLR